MAIQELLTSVWLVALLVLLIRRQWVTDPMKIKVSCWCFVLSLLPGSYSALALARGRWNDLTMILVFICTILTVLGLGFLIVSVWPPEWREMAVRKAAGEIGQAVQQAQSEQQSNPREGEI
jgi:hypothetical protein